MNKRELEEVKKGLDCCANPLSGGCKECPYSIYKYTCRYDLMFAALKIIKELEVKDD